ncbi:MAG: DUF4331 domain-containing protein, partial [Armatimonadetes bacterium]|nr:DUF4331 domain-containing protein [Armatimonadota bacterium]
QDGFNRLSVFGGDTVQSPFQNKPVPSGWPNGRRFGDDVIDIALTAIGSQGTLPAGTVLGDNVNSNDVTYPTVFPYIGVPHSGLNHIHHGTNGQPTGTPAVQPQQQQQALTNSQGTQVRSTRHRRAW